MAAPTAQEISRKLSLYSAAKKVCTSRNHTDTFLTLHENSQAPGTSSGAESDSDTSDILSPTAGPQQPSHILDSIAERNSPASDGSDSDDGHSSVHHLGGGAPSPGDEIALKSGYLWKKGERRKVNCEIFVSDAHGSKLETHRPGKSGGSF